MKTTNACDIAPLATHRPATTHTPLDAWLDSEIRMATLVLPLASGCRPPVMRVAPGGEGPVPLLVLGCCPPVVWDAVRRWCVWPRVGRGLFCYSFWDAASTSAI